MVQMVLNAIKQGAYLSACDGELLLALLALCCLVIFQPGVALMEATDRQHKTSTHNSQLHDYTTLHFRFFYL